MKPRGGGADFSIVLVNHDSGRYLDRCLDSIRRQRHPGPVEILVVDHRSTDGSRERLRGQPDVTLLEPGTNRGFAAGNNLAIARSTGEFVLCLNFDCWLDEDFLAEAFAAFRRHPEAGMISGRLVKTVDLEPVPYLDSTGIDFSALVPIDRGEFEFDRGQYAEPGEIFGPSGAAALYRRTALDEVADGPGRWFDERMFLYCEDIDLAWRIGLAGWRGRYVPGAVAYHERGATLRDDPKARTRHQLRSLRNRYLTIARNLRPRDLEGCALALLRQEVRFLFAGCRWRPLRWVAVAVLGLELARFLASPRFLADRRRSRLSPGRIPPLTPRYWQDRLASRLVRPARADAPRAIEVDPLGWETATAGVAPAGESGRSLLSGRPVDEWVRLSMRVPAELGERLKHLCLRVEIEATDDVALSLEYAEAGGRRGRFDWVYLAGGNGAYEVDLATARLGRELDGLSAWPQPWVELVCRWSLVEPRLARGALLARHRRRDRIRVRRIAFLET